MKNYFIATLMLLGGFLLFNSCEKEFFDKEEQDQSSRIKDTLDVVYDSLTDYMQITTETIEEKLVLQPDNNEGKDATIRFLSPDENVENNDAHNYYLSAQAWTNFGTDNHDMHSLIDFDLSNVPANTVITEAKLHLYQCDKKNDHYGANQAHLYKITEPWIEDQVTWNTMPAYSEDNKTLVPESTDPQEDYIIDVTQLIQDKVTNPENNFGFLLKLDVVEKYRALHFYSSNHSVDSLRPKLVVKYNYEFKRATIQPDSITEKDSHITLLSPNINLNNNAHRQRIYCMAWTNEGVDNNDHRILIDFNLKSLAPDIKVLNSNLYLYNDPDGLGQYGDNEANLYRITEPWNVDSVTWNNCPAFSLNNPVYIPPSTKTEQDYKINVTTQIKEKIKNPQQNHGFLMKLITEEKYRALRFASSQNPDASKRPKLVIDFIE